VASFAALDTRGGEPPTVRVSPGSSRLDPDDELVAALPASAAAVDAVEEKLRSHVSELKQRGVSWDRIAAALGVSRQAAWERFSDPN
jgi:hypothetical protein